MKIIMHLLKYLLEVLFGIVIYISMLYVKCENNYFPSKCENVVDKEVQESEYHFCEHCDCQWERRNTTTIMASIFWMMFNCNCSVGSTNDFSLVFDFQFCLNLFGTLINAVGIKVFLNRDSQVFKKNFLHRWWKPQANKLEVLVN